MLDNNLAWAQETKRMIDAEGGISEVVHVDVTSEESCEAAVKKTIELFGTVHILVNIVGVGGAMGDCTKVDLEAWDRDMRINVTSMVLMSRHVIPEMRKNGRGAIVNMSSVSGLLGGNPSLLYPVSKGAIIQMTRAMAAQHGKENIRVNCVCPGKFDSPASRLSVGFLVPAYAYTSILFTLSPKPLRLLTYLSRYGVHSNGAKRWHVR